MIAVRDYAPDNGGGSTDSSSPFTPYVNASGVTSPTDSTPFAVPAHAMDATPSIPSSTGFFGVTATQPAAPASPGDGTGADGTGNFGAVLSLFRSMFGSGTVAPATPVTGTPVLVTNTGTGSSAMSKGLILLVVLGVGVWFARKKGWV